MAVPAWLNRNDIHAWHAYLPLPSPIYFGTDGHRFVTMQGGRAFTLLPRVEIARRVFRKKKKKKAKQRQSRRPVHRALVPDEAPFPGILRPRWSAVCLPEEISSYPQPDSPVKAAAQMLPPPWPRRHHARGLSCAVCMRGSPT